MDTMKIKKSASLIGTSVDAGVMCFEFVKLDLACIIILGLAGNSVLMKLIDNLKKSAVSHESEFKKRNLRNTKSSILILIIIALISFVFAPTTTTWGTISIGALMGVVIASRANMNDVRTHITDNAAKMYQADIDKAFLTIYKDEFSDRDFFEKTYSKLNQELATQGSKLQLRLPTFEAEKQFV
jgi:hypothetical protein